VNPTDFEALMGQLDSPMVVVTTASAGARAGCLVGFHTQSSIHPARYAIWLSKANHTFRLGLLADTFAVHFLGETDRGLAELFGTQTGDTTDKFEQCEWTEGPDGVPLLDDCLNRFVARRVALLDEGGDHVCLVVEPNRAEHASPFSPMTFQQLRDLDAGHDSDDRQAPTGSTGSSTRWSRSGRR
jgi:flavin reductase (DIM6/NTAB) family NADH-FMN oxidoreductase RutF